MRGFRQHAEALPMYSSAQHGEPKGSEKTAEGVQGSMLHRTGGQRGAVVSVSSLSKCYPIFESPRERLKQFVLPRVQRFAGIQPRRYYREFWALRDISFDIERGESVGVIGRNGSGKSTLLQLICGTLAPTTGDVRTQGRIAALLELGSGFNPEFTGRENVFLNGALLGFSADEIAERYDAIVAFADIGEFVERPVKTYSSGMVMRLAFAVAAQVEPDILIVDEALAVGDAKFQAKCFERLRRLRDHGTSILLVTHSAEQIVTHCSRALLLDQGTQLEVGHPRLVVNRYLDLLFGKAQNRPVEVRAESTDAEVGAELLSQDVDGFETRPGYNRHEYRWGDGQAAVLDFVLSADGKMYPFVVESGAMVTVVFLIRFDAELVRPIVGITVKSKDGITLYGFNSDMVEHAEFEDLGSAGSVAQVTARFACTLGDGDYFISVGVATRNNEGVVPHDRRYDAIHLHVTSSRPFIGLTDLKMDLRAAKALR
jgi:lipopolysaccharide transport system ATP-binding protein